MTSVLLNHAGPKHDPAVCKGGQAVLCLNGLRGSVASRSGPACFIDCAISAAAFPLLVFHRVQTEPISATEHPFVFFSLQKFCLKGDDRPWYVCSPASVLDTTCAVICTLCKVMVKNPCLEPCSNAFLSQIASSVKICGQGTHVHALPRTLCFALTALNRRNGWVRARSTTVKTSPTRHACSIWLPRLRHGTTEKIPRPAGRRSRIGCRAAVCALRTAGVVVLPGRDTGAGSPAGVTRRCFPLVFLSTPTPHGHVRAPGAVRERSVFYDHEPMTLPEPVCV